MLTEIETGKVSAMFKVNKHNYYRALQILMDYIEDKYNFIEDVYYEDDSFVIKCVYNQMHNHIVPFIKIIKTLRLNAVKKTSMIDFTKENVDGSSLGD